MEAIMKQRTWWICISYEHARKRICAAMLGVVVRIIICLQRENSVSVGQGRAKRSDVETMLCVPFLTLMWERRKQRFWKNSPVDKKKKKDTCSDVKATPERRQNSSICWLPIEIIEKNSFQKTANKISRIFFRKWRQSFKRVKNPITLDHTLLSKPIQGSPDLIRLTAWCHHLSRCRHWNWLFLTSFFHISTLTASHMHQHCRTFTIFREILAWYTFGATFPPCIIVGETLRQNIPQCIWNLVCLILYFSSV